MAKYICGLRIDENKLDISFVDANSIEDLFWQLDEIANPYEYEIVKVKKVGIFQLEYEYLESEDEEGFFSWYLVQESQTEPTEYMSSLADYFVDNPNKFRITGSYKEFYLESIKKVGTWAEPKQ